MTAQRAVVVGDNDDSTDSSHKCKMLLASRIRTEPPDPARKLPANLYDMHHCCVYSEKLLIMDRGTV